MDVSEELWLVGFDTSVAVLVSLVAGSCGWSCGLAVTQCTLPPLTPPLNPGKLCLKTVSRGVIDLYVGFHLVTAFPAGSRRGQGNTVDVHCCRSRGPSLPLYCPKAISQQEAPQVNYLVWQEGMTRKI